MSQNKSTALTHTKKPFAKKGPQQRQQSFPTQMGQQLTSLYNLVNQRSTGGLADLETIGEEGVGHINVHRSSKTQLGSLLSTSANHQFTLFTKRFTNIDNLTMYYRSHCTNGALPTCNPSFAREFNKNQVKRFPQIQNLYVVVCLAYYEIFKNTPALLDALKENRLPFDSYFMTPGEGPKRSRHKASATLVSAIQEASQAVIDGKDPDLKKFMFQADRQALGTIAAREGRSFLEVARAAFSPRAIREIFQQQNPELAAEIQNEEKERQAAVKARREANKPAPKAKPVKQEKPMELGDASDIIKTEVDAPIGQQVDKAYAEYKSEAAVPAEVLAEDTRSLLALQAANAIAMGFEVEVDEAGEPLKASKGDASWEIGKEGDFKDWMVAVMDSAIEADKVEVVSTGPTAE